MTSPISLVSLVPLTPPRRTRLWQAGPAVALALLSACSGSLQSTTSRATPQSGDMMVRGTLGAKLDLYLRRIEPFGFSGTVLVADSTGVILQNGYGLAERASGRPLYAGSVLNTASITKVLTAAAILRLEADGKLSVGDSLSRFFPEAPADKARITLHHLLTHTAGLIDVTGADTETVSRKEMLRRVFAAPVATPPGQRYAYSNAGFSLLAAIIEQVSGVSYEAFLRQRLLGPAGMHHTGYTPRRDMTSARAHTYTPPVDRDVVARHVSARAASHWNLFGNGGLLSTVGDLYRWEVAFTSETVLPKAQVAKYLAPHFRRSETLEIAYDWFIEMIDGERVVHHGGDDPAIGANADYRRYPDQSTIILLANTRHNGASTRRFVVPGLRRLMRGDSLPNIPAVRPATAALLRPYCGSYVLESDSTAMITVGSSGGHLDIRAVGQAAIDLLVFNRAPASLRGRAALNANAFRLVTALMMDSIATLRSLIPDSTTMATTRAGWRKTLARQGTPSNFGVLGTTRLDRGEFLTTVRLQFNRDSMTVRFTWGPDGPGLNAEDELQPVIAGPIRRSPIDAAAWSPYWWLAAPDTLLTYDLASGQRLEAAAVRGPGGTIHSLTFHPTSTSELRFRHLPAMAGVCQSPW